MEIQLDHVAIHAADVARSEAFYTSVLGLVNQYPGRWDSSPTILMHPGSATGVAIFRATSNTARHDQPSPGEHANRPAGSIDHFAFRTSRADWEAYRERLSTLNIDFEERQFGISTSIFVRDPDGILVEVTTYPDS